MRLHQDLHALLQENARKLDQLLALSTARYTVDPPSMSLKSNPAV
jgi:hypothetical protein